MSDISKLIEAMRVSGEAGATRSGEADPILPLGQPVVWADGKLVKAPDAPKIAELPVAGAPKPADKPAERAEAPKPAERTHESARTPAEGASPGPRQAEGGRDKK